ncbi:uncharacterized protein UV8b_05295 [Ustilaginoidea virens]|uniref:Nonribosomal peptide synthetase sidN n=1 Tax=Ustilaginoidea virens TaxID=1159556 RepID=A0A8E5HUY9_USTVR|nr:uncharacterized protein UV8b_05295 [Ustilaginoidea virens]QUC21788.1 hypothetical protein UV8b_05295 [Ustilaginoidea virens]
MDHEVLSVSNPNPRRLPGPQLLHQLVASSNDGIAIDYLCEDVCSSYSYKQLHDASQQLSKLISFLHRELDSHADMIVPVMMPQCPQLYISLLAVLKAGGAFCPLNIETPPERVMFILNDVSAKVVLVTRQLAESIPSECDVAVIQVDALGSLSEYENISNRATCPDRLAYVMYTSGSTGTPKGVGLSHRAATQALLAHDRHLPQFTRFLQFAAPTFDVSVFEIFFPFFRGRTLVCVRREEMLNDLPASMRRMNVDACELTPTVAGGLLKKRQNVPSLRLLLTIGEMLKMPVIQEFGGNEEQESLLWAMYGPTEATIHCTLKPSIPSNSSPGSIGLPLDTVSCFVIKPANSSKEHHDFQLLPRGEAGELAIGGFQLARGYLNRPEQNTAAFIDSPYGRIYRTGDKAVMKSDGSFECLGRLSDGQVKLRGQRIELGEIEHAALRAPGCHGACAAVVSANLVLFCAVDHGVTEDIIEGICRSWLPRFMIPHDIVLMGEFPRLPSGKVNKKKLESEFKQQKPAAIVASEPSCGLTRLEMDMIDTISELARQNVNLQTKLATVGIDSLSAIKLVAALRHKGYDSSVADLLKLRTVGEICNHLQGRSRVCATPQNSERRLKELGSRSPVPQRQLLSTHVGGLVERVMACTELQSWILAETEQNSRTNCNEILLKAASSVKTETLFDAFSEVIQSNEILRTGFLQWEGRYISVVFPRPRIGQVEIRPELQRRLGMSTKEDFLTTFQVQLISARENEGPGIFIQAHHAIYDGWTMDMLLSDVSQLLQGISLPPRPQFKDIASFQTLITKEEKDNSRAFWSKALLNWSKVPFPKLLARPGPDEICTKTDFVEIAPAAVEELSRMNEISIAVLFQAALAMTWRGVTGEPDVLFGSVVSGRTMPVPCIEQIMGPCIASVPLRIDTGTMKTTLDILRSIHRSNRAAMEHCNLSLSEIGKLVGAQAGESLYDVLFVYQQSLYDFEGTHGLLRHVSHLDRLETKLLVEVEPRPTGFALQITYHSTSIESGFVDEVSQQIGSFCRAILLNSTGTLEAAGKEVRVKLSAFEERVDIKNEPHDLVSLFDASAKRNPDAEAIRFVTSVEKSGFKTTTLSYSAVNQKANQIAHHLQRSGAEVGDVIAIIMPKSAIFYTSTLGVLKAGCAYLPILPTTPAERIREILQQANAKHCLVDDALTEDILLPDSVTLLNVHSMSTSDMQPASIHLPSSPDRLAYVIFTSGSTGTPKGVAVTQRSIASNVAHLSTVYPITAARPRLLQACSPTFDVSVFEIYYAWNVGMSLCGADNDVLFTDLEHAIRELRITHLSLTPTVASLIKPQNVPQVECIVTAGEPLTSPVLDNWGSLLFQGYGPSETTNICVIGKMSQGDNPQHLGWALPSTSVFVMAPNTLDVLPIGWIGELCFGGGQVARGYLNDEALTAKNFIVHPFFGRIYRSGDMGRMLPDGSLMFSGRTDDQIKLRGQLIEASEVNSTLTNNSSTEIAITILVKGGELQSDQLATFYKPRHTVQSSKILEINAHLHHTLFSTLKSRLPAYMIPSYMIPVSDLPITPSGKVDKRILIQWFEALPGDYLQRASETSFVTEYDAQWTKLEQQIAQVVAESCNISKTEIGRWTPFASLGIDSISAIPLSRLLRGRLEFPVPISTILRNPTVMQLAQSLSRRDDQTPRQAYQNTRDCMKRFGTEVQEDLRHKSADIEDILPCVPLQEAMLLKGQGSYYNKILLRLQVSPSAMQSYFNEVSRRHGILRTCFVTTRNNAHPIAQVILRKWRLPWRTFEVTEPSLERASREHLDSLPEPLDSMIPPCSLAVIRYRGSNFLSFICHHALYDGIAMENIWREVESLAHHQVLPAPVSYLPFLQQSLTLPADVESFWQKEFEGFEGLSEFARSSKLSFNQCTHTSSIDMPFEEIQRKARRLGVSLLSVCQASWAAVLASMFDKPDITFGNVVSGRTTALDGIDRLVAPCFNTIPLRMDISKSTQSIDLLERYQNLNVKLFPYQFSPLKLVQKIVGTQNRVLFNTLFLLQKPLTDMDKSIWTLEEDSGSMDVALLCEVVPCPKLNSIILNLHYDMDIITDELASSISDTFKLVMRSMLSSPFDSVPGQFLTLSSAENFRSLVIMKTKRLVTEQEGKGSQWTVLEKKVRKSIASVSKTEESVIHHHTTIFQLGLDSINAVQIASLLRSQGFPVSSSDVVECPSCERLAARIEQSLKKLGSQSPTLNFAAFRKAIAAEIIDGVPSNVNIEAVLPCTAIQNAMLTAFLQSAEGSYLNFLFYRIEDRTNIQELAGAWKLLQQHHPMLRTGFVPTSHPHSAFAMLRREATDLNPPVQLFCRESSNVFNFSSWKEETRLQLRKNMSMPPWRIALVQDGEAILMHIAIHHALYDAISFHGLIHGLYQFLQKKPCRFGNIEPALAEIVSRTQDDLSQSRQFWQSYAERTVVNKFPVMTPLRVGLGKVIIKQKQFSMTHEEVHAATALIGTSLQVVLQATWARLLASYLGERSVVFGVCLAGRTTDETITAPFPCITTVPIVVETTKSNKSMMNRMNEFNSTLHKHQFAALSSIQKWLGYPSTPVFDTILVYQNARSSPSVMPGWDLVADEPCVEYAVSLEYESSREGDALIRITTRSDVLPSEQAELMLRQFDAILAHFLKQPDGTEHELYTTEEGIFSISPARMPAMIAQVELVHQLVEKNAESQPDSPALEFVKSFDSQCDSASVWSYRELDEAGNQVAHLLSDMVSVGDTVAVHFPKCPEAYISILGVLKAGCSFVALDPSLPDARKKFILEDSKAACLLTDDPAAAPSDIGVPAVLIDIGGIKELPVTRVIHEPGIMSTSTCYCLYTSGTTGTPKGCEITHENTVQAMMAFQHLFEGHWQRESRWLQFAAFHFDVSVLEQYWSWSVGITVVAAPKDLILDDLVGSISKLRITHLDLTPSLARLTHPDELPDLCKGVFITGGEQLNQDILDAWGPKAVIYNAYGPTEATIGVTMYKRVPINGRPSNIGQQFPNVGSYIFHTGTEIPVLRGGVGELCVSGKLVGKGYLQRPELSKEKFPVLSYFKERVYRTGDLVRILHDGCFEFLGRADDQVKLRGQRLEIEEINQVIRSGNSQVQNAATLVISHEKKDFLVAFVTRHDEATTHLRITGDDDEITKKARKSCLEKLPGYMVPTYFIPLSYIPLSSNNKVEAKRLRLFFDDIGQERLMQFTGQRSHSRNTHLDHTTLETVVGVLAEFCRIPRVKILRSTSIFDLGVDSISALQLSTLLKNKGIDAATPARILRFPIVADLVHELAGKGTRKNSSQVAKEVKQMLQVWQYRYRGIACRELQVEPCKVEYITPCSPLQEGMISAALSENSTRPYFNWFDIQLRSETSMTRVQQAWELTLLNNPILRSVFLRTTDGFFQVALHGTQNFWHLISVAADDGIEAALEDQRSSWIASNSSHIVSPFQFIQVQGPGKQALRLHMFHGLYDGNSFELMNKYALCVYESEHPPPAPSYVEALYRGPLRSFEFCKNFWISHLGRWEFCPISFAAPSLARSRFIECCRFLPIEALENLRSQANVTLQAVVLSLWTIVLQTHISRMLTVGVIVAGRSIDLPHIENTMGPLFNTIPFFNQSLVGLTWKGLVRRCHEFNTDILPFQHVPLRDIQRWCSKSQPLFDNLFAFRVGSLESRSGEEENPWTIVEGQQVNIDYPLAFEATDTRDGQLHVRLVACEDVLNSEAMEGMINHFHQMMTTVRQDTLLAENVPEQAVATTCKLSAVPHSRTENAPEQESDWTPISLALRDELCILAGISPEHIGPDTSILDLGIDSIDSIKISARLAKRDIKVSASQIVRFQTISAITGASSAVSIPQNSTNSAILADIKRGLKSYLEARSVDLSQLEDVLPPTPLQQSMIAGMIESDFEWYFNQDILELNEGVDIIRLKEAWETVVEASPILRTGFLEVDSCEYDISYCQVVFRQKQVYISLDQAEDISQLQCYLSRASNIARKGAATSGLFQVALVSTPHKSYMIISMAHAIYDGWSLGLTFQDVKAAYRDSFKPRNHWQILDSEPALFMSPKADAFWEEYLADASPTIFEKKAMDRDGSQEPEGVYRSETLSAQQVSEIGEFCKRASVSLQSLCLACWAAVSASWVQSLDTVFGVVLFGRDFEGAHELNFPTINTVAFRSLLHGSASVFLSYMESNLADVRTHQRVSLRDAQASMRLGSKRKRLFNSLFILQKSRTNQEPDAWKSIGSSSAVEYPICVEAELSEDHLVWRVACKKDHFSQSEAEEILSKLDQVLHYFLSSPESEVLSFSDDGVSICGMPSWPTKDTVLQDEEDVGADLNEGVLMDEWSETSSHIRQVLSEVSAVPLESILPASTLYHLGLDSISAIKVSLLLRRRNIRLKPRDLAEANSISEMARRTSWDETPLNASHAQTRNWKVDHFVSEEHVLNRCGVMPRDVMAVLPATPLQVYMLSVWHGSGGSVFYPEFHYEAPSTYTHGQISKAWSKVVRMVPILRARLVSTGSRALPWVQVVLNGEPRSSERFDQPLVQFLAQQSQNEKSWIIRLCIHHALYDGFSLPRIMQLYDEALQKGDLFDQAQSSVAFAKWQEFSTAPLLPANMQTRKAFWMAYLAGCGPASSRFASTFPSLGSTAARVSYLREKALVSVTKLRKLASTNGISLQSLLLAAYAKSLCPDGTGAGVESSIVFGLYLANRTSSKEELDTTYPTLNLVPLRVNLSRGDDVVNVGGAIHEDLKLIQAEGRAQVGLWEIHAWTGMQIHTFVNILSLPDGGHGADVTAQPGVMRATKQERTLDQNIRLEPLKTPWLQGNAVQDAYPVPLDVEMSVSESGLDIGVFGSTDMLSRAEAPLLVDSILEHLQDVA